MKVVLDFQQQCSWLNQKPAKHTPSFRSVIQWAEMSIRPAKEPRLKERFKKRKFNNRLMQTQVSEGYSLPYSFFTHLPTE